MAIPSALARRRNYAGPAIFSYGFRPFFLGGALWAALSLLLWIAQYTGDLVLPSAISPLHWHIHEMLYGYVAAIVAGFLLTAIPNWTGRLPVLGPSLAALSLLWLAGRVAMLTTATIGLAVAAVIDIAFLVVLAAVAAREIIAGKNWRNLRVLVLVVALITANVTYHAEILWSGAPDYGIRGGIAAVILLISLIGGRIIPSFTINWMKRVNPGRMPQPFGRYDAVTLAFSVVAFALWIGWPEAMVTGLLLMAAGVLHVVRLMRWAGDRTFSDRLVLVLHAAYLFVPLGFLLTGAAILWPAHIPLTAGIHAWTAGAVGLMTLAVMTRATLGHTGHALAASPMTQAIYALAFCAALLRILAAFSGDLLLMYLSAVAWILAFGGFVVVYGPILAGFSATRSGSAK